MFFKSSIQPLCRFCGKPIPKRTERVYFGCAPNEVERGRGRGEQPANKTRRSATSTARSSRSSIPTPLIDAGDTSIRTVDVPRYVRSAGVWDRETYIDEFFCKGEHAKDLALPAPERHVVDAGLPRGQGAPAWVISSRSSRSGR
jgi:hypothetical protein